MIKILKNTNVVKLLSMILLVVICIFGNFVNAAVKYSPTNDFFVNDFADILYIETKNDILKFSREIESKTGAQLVVVTVPNLDGADVESYANELFNKWGIGKQKDNNGVLLLVSKEDRKVRIEVGYGLEGAINDGKAGRILDDNAVPSMKNNDFDTGVLNTVKALKGVIYNEYQIEGGVDNYEEDDTGVIIVETLMVVSILSVFGGIFIYSILYKRKIVRLHGIEYYNKLMEEKRKRNMRRASVHMGGGFRGGGFGGGGSRGSGGSSGGGGSSRGF